jgi:hypothetical protein
MTAVDTRRATRFWWIALLVLPLVNPVVLVLVTWATGGENLGFVGIALWIGIANGVFLWRFSDGAWTHPEDRARRVVLGLAIDLALSVAFGFAEFFVYFWIVCGGGGCFG